MQFKIPKLDLRNPSSGSTSIDDEQGNLAGQLLFGQNMGRIVILLGKYRGDFKTHEECQAFADGVAAVLNHMTRMDEKGIIGRKS
jgi:hypothetical protein